nr:hypothetical protein [Tanacetum cinerariifolium]
MEKVDSFLIRSMWPKSFIDFAYVGSSGASAGILKMWHTSLFVKEEQIKDPNYLGVIGSWFDVSNKKRSYRDDVGGSKPYPPKQVEKAIGVEEDSGLRARSETCWVVKAKNFKMDGDETNGRLAWIKFEGLSILARNLNTIKLLAKDFRKLLEVRRLDFDVSIFHPIKALLLIPYMDDVNQVIKIKLNGKLHHVKVFEDCKQSSHLLASILGVPNRDDNKHHHDEEFMMEEECIDQTVQANSTMIGGLEARGIASMATSSSETILIYIFISASSCSLSASTSTFSSNFYLLDLLDSSSFPALLELPSALVSLPSAPSLSIGTNEFIQLMV